MGLAIRCDTDKPSFTSEPSHTSIAPRVTHSTRVYMEAFD